MTSPSLSTNGRKDAYRTPGPTPTRTTRTPAFLSDRREVRQPGFLSSWSSTMTTAIFATPALAFANTFKIINRSFVQTLLLSIRDNSSSTELLNKAIRRYQRTMGLCSCFYQNSTNILTCFPCSGTMIYATITTGGSAGLFHDFPRLLANLFIEMAGCWQRSINKPKKKK